MLKSATADLFGAVEVPLDPEAARPAARLLSGALSPPPPPQPERARSRPRHLWYAVVFPALAVSAGASESTQAILERLCLHAQRFTPWVSIDPPNALLLEIKGSVKLFGSLAALEEDIDAAWSGLELHAQSSTAPSALAALWLARAGHKTLIEDPCQLAGRLASLPLTCTAWEGRLIGRLRTLGINRIGELMRLPRAGLARRFGPAMVLDLDIALARQAAPRRAFVARERFRERCDFESEAETVLYVEKALDPLIERCARFLRERQAGVQALEIRLRHRARSGTRVRLGLASVTGDVERLKEVARHRLARLELAAPVMALELLSGRLQPLSAGSGEVFARTGSGNRDTVPQLVERLRARLGEQAVYGICPVPEHRPEAAWRRVPACRAQTLTRKGLVTSKSHGTSKGLPRAGEMPRPVWLLSEPAKIPEADIEPLPRGCALREDGPERIESGWWDGKDVARDYYVVRHAGGARLWVFQDRRSRCWYVHGVFA